MAGINDQAILNQRGSSVLLSTRNSANVSGHWKIHDRPVDFKIDPKLRCRPEHVGRVLYDVESWRYIYGVTTDSLILHSIVLYVDEEPAVCGSIVPFALPTSAASVEFKSGIFGRIYIVQWPGGYPRYNAPWINHN